MIVIDASAILDVLLNRRSSDAIAARCFTRDETLHAPHLLDVEIAQATRRRVDPSVT